MAIQAIFRGEVQQGVMVLEKPDGWKLQLCILEGKQIEVILRQYRKGRSNEQNRWYWGCIVPLLAEHCGYDKEEMHDALRWKFLRKHAALIETVRSTTELTTAEFSDYCEQCRRFAAEMSVYIPSPNEVEIDNSAV